MIKVLIERQNNTDNTSYLNPIHSQDKNSSTSVSVKSVNNSYLSFHESDQNIHSDQSQGNNDSSSYLHHYHTIDEDWKEKTHQYGVTHVSHNDTDDSPDSSTYMLTDGYLNPYQPLKDGWKEMSHNYEAPVTVHQCEENITLPFLFDSERKITDNDEIKIIQDKQDMSFPNLLKNNKSPKICHKINNSDNTKTQLPINKPKFPGCITSSKQEQDVVFDYTGATISLSYNKEIKEMSNSTSAIPEILKDLKNKCNSYEIYDISTSASNYSTEDKL